ncbi:MAG: hypothetical protein U9R17_14900 [Thermodesulfobacteriota bacterium]|nr:hypothetical protein [Thermodesulfobacteriota bacterium]
MIFRLIAIACVIFVPSLSNGVETRWGGHLRVQGSLSMYDDSHIIALSGKDSVYADWGADFRIKGLVAFDSPITIEVHYEAGISGGDARDALNQLSPVAPGSSMLLAPAPTDETRFFNLTSVEGEEKAWVYYHRIDRMVASWEGDRATVRLGRQALSWGNGLVFNPADLLNPFAPTDVVRDYKIGTDMVLFQTFGRWMTDLQVVYVPRRDRETGDIETDQSSIAAKVRLQALTAEWEFLAARHYDETVIGAGGSGYLGGAAWRADALYIFLREEADRSGYFTAVVNLDYSWVLGKKNWYGLVELYYNGLGVRDPRDALKDPSLVERVTRGELFTTGKWYATGQLRFEYHPLVNLYLSMIGNISDGSLLSQPRVTWDALQSLQVLIGADIPLGSDNTEYGGITDPATQRTTSPPYRLYGVVTWYF